MKVVDKKRQLEKDKVVGDCKKCGGSSCVVCLKKVQFIDKLAISNIPVRYWRMKMSNFQGPDNLKKVTNDYIENIENNYINGSGICFTGQYGTGKTYCITSILKDAVVKKYDVYYTSLLDIGHYMTNFKYSDDYYHTVTRCDFLAIDEVDSRHFSDSDDAQRYFGANLERVIRYRAQNNLPILIGTNNASLEEVFTGQYKRVIDSLMEQVSEIVPALGKDFRKKNKAK